MGIWRRRPFEALGVGSGWEENCKWRGGGSINGDENCLHSLLMFLCFKEKTVSQSGKGKALITELKEDIFPEF